MFGKQTHEAMTQAMDSVDEMKELMVNKFDEYDREFRSMSKSAKICIGVGLGLSATNTIILLKILKKMK